MGEKTEQTCEGWYGGCGAAATKSVQAVGEHGWCRHHYEAFQADRVGRGEGEVKF